MWLARFAIDYDESDVVIVCTTRDHADRLADAFGWGGQHVEEAHVDFWPQVAVHYAMVIVHWSPSGWPGYPSLRDLPQTAEEMRTPLWPGVQVKPEPLQMTRACAHWMLDGVYQPYIDVAVYGPDREPVEAMFRDEISRLTQGWPRSWWDLADARERQVAQDHWLRDQPVPPRG